MKPFVTYFAFAALIASAASDPFAGTWTLNPRKSKYPDGTMPQQMVIRMEATENGIRYRSETTDSTGRQSRAEYVADYDGKEAVVKGAAGLLLPVSLKRVDPYTVEASYLRGRQVIATSRRVISKNGRMMTITTTSKDKDGKTVTNIGVYSRGSGTDQASHF